MRNRKKMRKIIAKLFNLYTQEQAEKMVEPKVVEIREYHQKVIKEMARTGTIPQECDLKLPKKSMVIMKMEEVDSVQGEIIAKEGRWLRLPNDREKVIIRYY